MFISKYIPYIGSKLKVIHPIKMDQIFFLELLKNPAVYPVNLRK